MTDLLNYIKTQKNKGHDDYTVLQSTKSFSKRIANIRAQNNKRYAESMIGGGSYALTDEEKIEVLKSLETIDANVDGYEQLKAAAQNIDGTIEGYDDFDQVTKKLGEMAAASSTTTKQQDDGARADPLDVTTDALVDNEDDVNTSAEKEKQTLKGPKIEKTTVQVETYATLNPGDYLYYPTQDIKQFDDSMMFVDIPKVLNQTEKRSFTMFFTPNEEYARRYSGLWSLNKRDTYVHKLVVKKGMPIKRIKVINSKKISDAVNNDVLAHNMCGDSVDGFINGIKIEQSLGDNNPSVAEYYICNPSLFFDHVETWLQFDATTWVMISPSNTRTIQVPPNQVATPGPGINDGADEDLELAAAL